MSRHIGFIGLVFLLLSPTNAQFVIGEANLIPIAPDKRRVVDEVLIPSLPNHNVTVFYPVQDTLESAKQFYIQPYIAVDWVKLEESHKQECKSGRVEPPYFVVEFDLFNPIVTQEVKEHLAERKGSSLQDISVSMLPTALIQVSMGGRGNSVREQEIYSWPVPLSELAKSGNRALAGQPRPNLRAEINFTCSDLERIINVRDVHGSAYVATNNVETDSLTASKNDFADWFIGTELVRDASQGGSIKEINRSSTSGGGFSFNFAGFGGGGGGSSSNNSVELKDTRSRAVSSNLIENSITRYLREFSAQKYCETDKCADLDLLRGMVFDIVKPVTPTIELDADKGQLGLKFANGEISYINDKDAVDRFLKASSNPNLQFSNSTNIDCKAAVAAITGGASSGAEVGATVANSLVAKKPSESDEGNTGSSNSNSANTVENNETATNQSKSNNCGYESDAIIKDKNDVEWKFTGTEWIPTSVELYLISESAVSEKMSSNYAQVFLKSKEIVELPLTSVESNMTLSAYEQLKSDFQAFKVDLEQKENDSQYIIRTPNKTPRAHDSTPVNHTKFTELCGDIDGCTVTIGMYEYLGKAAWEGGFATSAKHSIFYNPETGAFRGSSSNGNGVDNNGSVQHAAQSWECFITDDDYTKAGADESVGFFLLNYYGKEPKYQHQDMVCVAIIDD